jgi:hypothetical protein
MVSGRRLRPGTCARRQIASTCLPWAGWAEYFMMRESLRPAGVQVTPSTALKEI